MLLYISRESHAVNAQFSACGNFVELSRPTIVRHKEKVIILVADDALFRYNFDISFGGGGLNVE